MVIIYILSSLLLHMFKIFHFKSFLGNEIKINLQ